MVWQVVIKAHEEFVEFRGYLGKRRQYDDESPVVLAPESLPALRWKCPNLLHACPNSL
jgi:hypothetical protein